MNRQIAISTACAAALGLLALAAPAAAQHPSPAPAAESGATANMQGDDSVWRTSPYIHAFYDLSVATLKGKPQVDVAAYEQKSYAIFRDFGVAMGVGPEHMQDHLKLIPRQVVGIAKDDPAVLDNYDNFVTALMGPK